MKNIYNSLIAIIMALVGYGAIAEAQQAKLYRVGIIHQG
jgi:hypothetical protein